MILNPKPNPSCFGLSLSLSSFLLVGRFVPSGQPLARCSEIPVADRLSQLSRRLNSVTGQRPPPYAGLSSNETRPVRLTTHPHAPTGIVCSLLSRSLMLVITLCSRPDIAHQLCCF
ncbi:hypothetical protein L1887_10637 [Cichorium endivia]|nr:hypothetical protein L1887_10637 [Cichorium endivia]